MNNREVEIMYDVTQDAGPIQLVAQAANKIGLEGDQINDIRVIGEFGGKVRVIFKTSRWLKVI